MEKKLNTYTNFNVHFNGVACLLIIHYNIIDFHPMCITYLCTSEHFTDTHELDYTTW